MIQAGFFRTLLPEDYRKHSFTVTSRKLERKYGEPR
jgi:hypothetical protein